MASGPDFQLIFADNPGSLPASYDLASDISVQSIVARIDGAGAAGSFLPTLSLYTQDGHLIARVPSDVTYAVGDTGVVTWSPFLARRVAATPPTPGGPIVAFIHREKTTGGGLSPQTMNADTAGDTITFDTTQSDQAGVYFDTTSTSVTRIKSQGANSQGVYRFLYAHHYATEVNAASVVSVSGIEVGWFPSVYWKEPFGPTGAHRGDLALVLDFVARLWTANNHDIRIITTIEGAANQFVESAELTIEYLGTWAGTSDADFVFN